MNNNTQLFRVTIQANHSFYVVATDPTSAYDKLRKLLDKKDIYTYSGRRLQSIKLMLNDGDIQYEELLQ